MRFLERGINFRGNYFLERGANLESRAAHTHPKNTQVPPRATRPSPTLSPDHPTYIPTERDQTSDFIDRDEVEVDKKGKRTRPSRAILTKQAWKLGQ